MVHEGSAKHHPNSSGNIGKSARDGQAALDNSFPTIDADQRVAVQDGKIIVFQRTETNVAYGHEVYHGYIVEDFFSIKNSNVQQALVNNKLVRSMKSGAVIKQ